MVVKINGKEVAIYIIDSEKMFLEDTFAFPYDKQEEMVKEEAKKIRKTPGLENTDLIIPDKNILMGAVNKILGEKAHSSFGTVKVGNEDKCRCVITKASINPDDEKLTVVGNDEKRYVN